MSSRFEPIVVSSSSRSVKFSIRRLLQQIAVVWITIGFAAYEALEPPVRRRRREIRVISGGRAAHPADG